MSHNDPKEVVLHAADEKTVRELAQRALGKKRRLSFFERRDADALGKSLDVHGNIDLNVGANQTSYAGSGRVNPNARVQDGFQSGTREASELAKKEQLLSRKAVCHRHCAKSIGRPNCLHCYGQGWSAVETEGVHQSRHLMEGSGE